MLYYVYTDSGRSLQPAWLFLVAFGLDVIGIALPFLLKNQKKFYAWMRFLLWGILGIQVPTGLFLLFTYLR